MSGRFHTLLRRWPIAGPRAVRVLSAGAAEELVRAVAPTISRDFGIGVSMHFAPVGELVGAAAAGEQFDVLVTSRRTLGELAKVPGSVEFTPIGTVATCLAVRRGDPPPVVNDADSLRRCLFAADEVFCPDVRKATAGVHLAATAKRLGLSGVVWPRLRVYANGGDAMHGLAASNAARPIGIAQATEITRTPGVKPAGPLPEPFSLRTVYGAIAAADSVHPAAAAAFIASLAECAAGALGAAAGFES